MKFLCVIASLIVVFAPRNASAQFYVSPFVDTTLTSPVDTGDSSQVGFGLSLGKIGRIAGTETEIGYHPEIVGNDANGLNKTRVVIVSESLLAGPVIGKAKPYGVIGAGDLFLNVSSKTVGVGGVDAISESLSKNYFTIDAGAGLMYFFHKRIAARGDLRYFRAYGVDFNKDQQEESPGLNLPLKHFTFWRAAVGVVFTF